MFVEKPYVVDPGAWQIPDKPLCNFAIADINVELLLRDLAIIVSYCYVTVSHVYTEHL